MQFKPIAGFESKYIIYENGDVLSLPKGNGNGNKNRFLKQEVIKAGHTNYRRVSLSKNGKVHRFAVHRLVAAAFLEEWDSSLHVNHIDNNGENNNVSNLEIVTHVENMQHSAKQGRQDIVRKLGGNALAAKRQAAMEKSLKVMLGKAFISTNFGYRSTVTYICSICGKQTTKRSDNIGSITNVTCSRKCTNIKFTK